MGIQETLRQAQMLRGRSGPLPQTGGLPPQYPAIPSAPTAFGKKVWAAGQNGQKYDNRWLAQQLNLADPNAAITAQTPPDPPRPVVAQGPNTVPEGPPEPAQQMMAGSPNRDAPSPFDSMSPEMAQSLMSLGGKDRQMKYAEKLRDRDPLKGTSFKNSVGGETFVGSGPGAFALRGYENFRNRKDIAKLDKDQTQGRVGILDLLRGKKRGDGKGTASPDIRDSNPIAGVGEDEM